MLELVVRGSAPVADSLEGALILSFQLPLAVMQTHHALALVEPIPESHYGLHSPRSEAYNPARSWLPPRRQGLEKRCGLTDDGSHRLGVVSGASMGMQASRRGDHD